MNKEQYNNIIENTLDNNPIETYDSNLPTVKYILNKMGIPLPNGNLQDIFNILRTNNYMGWRMYTLQEAQNFASNGVPSIGISKNTISILNETNERASRTNNNVVISLSENTDIHSVSDMLFYSFTTMRTSTNEYADRTWGSLDDAKDYYGWDFTYTYCGGYYNYYYTYSDGSRMYFHVG